MGSFFSSGEVPFPDPLPSVTPPTLFVQRQREVMGDCPAEHCACRAVFVGNSRAGKTAFVNTAMNSIIPVSVDNVSTMFVLRRKDGETVEATSGKGSGTQELKLHKVKNAEFYDMPGFAFTNLDGYSEQLFSLINGSAKVGANQIDSAKTNFWWWEKDFKTSVVVFTIPKSYVWNHDVDHEGMFESIKYVWWIACNVGANVMLLYTREDQFVQSCRNKGITDENSMEACFRKKNKPLKDLFVELVGESCCAIVDNYDYEAMARTGSGWHVRDFNKETTALSAMQKIFTLHTNTMSNKRRILKWEKFKDVKAVLREVDEFLSEKRRKQS